MIYPELDSLIKHVQIFDNTKQDPIVLEAMKILKQLKTQVDDSGRVATS